MGIRCRRCQAENLDGCRFCVECGALLALACVACGFPNGPVAKFCGGCGASLTGSTARVQAEFSTPLVYTPEHLAEKILRSRASLQGERKQVTVLFADLKGSMELLAGRDPEEARRLLDPVLERMLHAVHSYEGTVNQIMGDGIMALFGAPLALEDHAVRACYAALRMQEIVTRYADDVQRAGGTPVMIRVGLNSGEVVVRSISSDLNMDYTAVGQTTHLSARMEQMAKPGSILITAHTLRLVEGFVDATRLGEVAVRGLDGPVEVWELRGAGRFQSRLQAATARGLTPFVGRQSELDGLGQVLARAAGGRGGVVGVVGEPGVGKSRLFFELRHSARTQGWLVLESASVSYGKATPYFPVISLLKNYFEIDARDDARTVQGKVTRKLLALDRALEPTLPAFLALLEVLGNDPSWRALDPQQRRQRTQEAVKRLVLRASQVGPVLLIFEDLHWADSETDALLDSLVESLPAARVVLLVNYRPEYRHRWVNISYYTQLRIDSLRSESSEELLRALLGNDPTLEPLTRLLIARTEGNPFFLEESVHSLVETQVLVGERGHYRVGKPLEGIRVPVTVQAIVAARIDRLPPAEKRILQVASVIGKDVSLTLLQALSGTPEATLRQTVSHLQTAEFLYEARLFPDLEYTFKHALTHEVAYGSLLMEARRALHAQIVEAMEQLAGDRAADHIERLATHAFAGEVWDKALTYAREAGARAVGRSASREAVASFERALKALTHLPQTRDVIEQAIDLRFAMRHALFPLGEQAEISQRLQEAEALADSVGDQHRLGRVACYMTSCYWAMGEYDRAIASGERALALAVALGDVTLRIDTSLQLGYTYHAVGSYREAMELLRSGESFLHETKLPPRLIAFFKVFGRCCLGWCFADLGEFEAGRASVEEGIHLAEAADHLYGLVAGCSSLGMLHLTRGVYADAIPVLERALRLCQISNFPVFLPMSAACLGAAYAQSGRLDEGLALLEQIVRRDTTSKHMVGQARWLVYYAEALIQGDRLAEAREAAVRAVSLARACRERGHEAAALWVSGEVAARREDTDGADALYREAMALARRLNMRPLMAHCLAGLGANHRRMGRVEDGLAELSAAIELYRSLGMSPALSKAEGRLALG